MHRHIIGFIFFAYVSGLVNIFSLVKVVVSVGSEVLRIWPLILRWSRLFVKF